MSAAQKPMFGKLALLGIGLIGSSIAHATRRGGLAGHIAGYEPTKEVLERARAMGFADSLHDDIESAVRDADLVIMAAPVGAYASLAQAMAPALKPGAIVSDAGSVKMAVLRDAGPHIPKGVHFIPAHPVSGT